MNRFIDVEPIIHRLPHIHGYLDGPVLPLAETLQSICRRIKQLEQSIKTAKKNCCFPSKYGLTRDESAAIYLYTMEWGDTSLYKVLNTALRSSDRKTAKQWFPYLRLFHEATQKIPDVQKNLWRGIGRDITHNYKKDEVITWWGISSCSPSLSVIQGFLKHTATIFLIQAVHGKDISLYSSYPEEKEILLCPATQLRVESDALDKSGFHLVQLQEITERTHPSPVPTETTISTLVELTFQVFTDSEGNRYE